MTDRPYQYLYNAKWARASRLFLKTYKPFKNHPDKRLKDIVGLCVYCMQSGKTTPAAVVDHIVPHKGDIELFWDESNWQPLCKHCHDSIKAQEEARGYAVGCDADGMPLDRKHGWNKEQNDDL